MSDSYLSIKDQSEGFYKEKGSKFLSFVVPCSDQVEAKAFIDDLRKEHHTAVHVCFAWRFGTNSPYTDRYSDDGEPTNSAGKPIFGQILSFEVTNVLIAVVRYYGGTKLGVGGLISAYKTAAKEALANANIIKQYVYDSFRVNYQYDQTGDVMNILNNLETKIIEQGFDENQPWISFHLRRSLSNQVQKEFEKYHDISLTFLKNKE